MLVNGKQRILVKRAVATDAEHLTALVRDSDAYRGEYADVLRDYEVTTDYIDRHQVFVALGSGEGEGEGADEGEGEGPGKGEGAGGADRLLGAYGLILDPPELDLLFVANDAQGLGIGRHLVDHMMGQARLSGMTAVRVVSHPPAESFYLRMGARRIGTLPARPPLVTWDRPELQFTV